MASQSVTEFPSTPIGTCLICGSPRLEPGGFAYLFQKTRFPAVRCGDCDLVFLARQPTEHGLQILYSESYFESDYHCGHESSSYFESADGQRRSASVLLAQMEELIRPGSILEIGCAGGYFLETARERGWSPRGIEISEAAAAFARCLGIDVHVGSIQTAGVAANSLDAIYMGDVLEHVSDPVDTLRHVARALTKGGIVMIAGPITINSIDRRLGLTMYKALGKTKILSHPPYHLIEFTPQTLTRALSQANLEVVSIRQSKIPPAWRNPRRRPAGEHLAKLALDAANWALTKTLGRFGDRAVAIARNSG